MFETARELYNYLGLGFDGIQEDTRHGYLTINTGSDGKDYYLYFDGVLEGVACVASGAVVSDAETIKRLFPWWCN